LQRRYSRTVRVSWCAPPGLPFVQEKHSPRTLAFGIARGKRTVKAGWLFRRVVLKSLQIREH
jgi:hypothetical protein